jgi:enterochelin esterase family protein
VTTVNELLPRLYTEYRITRDPERHAIAGWSSGAIAAFTVAWERPDHFRKVLSGIGTYVNLAGGVPTAHVTTRIHTPSQDVLLVA